MIIEIYPINGEHVTFAGVDIAIYPDGLVKQLSKISNKQTHISVCPVVTDSMLDYTQQQYSSILTTVTASMLNYGTGNIKVTAGPTWDEIKRRG